MYAKTFALIAVLAGTPGAAAQVPPIQPIPPIPAIAPVTPIPALPVIPTIPSVRMMGLDGILMQADMALRSVQPALTAITPHVNMRLATIHPSLLEAQAALQSVGPHMREARAALWMALPAMRAGLYDSYWYAEQGTPSREAPEPWIQGDPADSLYQAARGALNRGENTTAAALFARIRERYPRSGYVPDSYYWQAFALRRSENTESLRTARRALDEQKVRFPNANTRGDAEVVRQQILGALARRGDAEAAAELEAAGRPVNTGGSTNPQTRGQDCPREGDEDDMRIAALNALMQMNSPNAIPILRDLLAKRDECSVVLRRKAIFILSQKRSTETEDILLNSARNDPDRQVREEAVQWLHQVGTDRSVAALDSIMMGTNDPELQKKAIFSLSQSRSPRAGEALRRLIERSDVSTEVRGEAIQWLGQNRRHPDNAEFLRQFYRKTDNQKLKEQTVFAISQMGGVDAGKFMLEIAADEREPIEARKNALFWASQTRSIDLAAYLALYDGMRDRELKKHLIYTYSQRRESAAVDKLMDIARNEQDRQLKLEAIQWLAQSRDPRVVQFLAEIINR